MFITWPSYGIEFLMNTFILFCVMITSNGEVKTQVSEHKTILSCKVDQFNYQDLDNRIKYYCSRKM